MIISYRKAIPDYGVAKLEQELRSLIGQLDSSLTDKINDLDARVSTLEQTGTMAISAVVVDNDNRNISVSIIATDHTVGTSVSINVTDSAGTTISDTDTFTANTGGDKQLASVSINASTLVAGTLNIVATSQDKYGKSRTDTAVRTYSPVATAISFQDINIYGTHRTASVAVEFDIGFPVDQLLSGAGATLTVINTNDPNNVIVNKLVATRQFNNTNVLLWEGVSLITAAENLDFLVEATDAYGDPVEGRQNSVDSSMLKDAAIFIASAYSQPSDRFAIVEAVIWHPSSHFIVELETDGVTVSRSAPQATATNYVGSDPDVDYDGARKYVWTIPTDTLNPATITATVSGTDTYGRNGSVSQAVPYAPLGVLEGINNSINSAAKTLTIDLSTTYVSIGQTASLVISSAVNGHSETHTATTTEDGVSFSSIDISAFPFGRINESVTVEDQLGNIISWDDNVMFDDVQGEITWANGGIDSNSDIAYPRWRQTGDVTVDRILITDTTGKRVELVGISSTPYEGDVYREALDISTLRYGSLTILIEGRDGANRPLSESRVLTYVNEEGFLRIDTVDFNPTTRQARVRGRYNNIVQNQIVSLIHYPVGQAGNAQTEQLFTAASPELHSFDETFTYPYSDLTNLDMYLSAIDIKGATTQSLTETVSTGQSGSVNVNTSLNQVTGALVVSGSVNSSVTAGTRVDILISGASSLSSSATVQSDGTFSVNMQLPANYGTLHADATAVDAFGKTITGRSTFTYNNVNGSISVTSVSTTTPSSEVTVAGSSSNMTIGEQVRVDLRQRGSSTNRVTAFTTIASGGSWEVAIPISGGLTNPELPFGNITAVAQAEDKGDTVRTGTRDGVFGAEAGWLTPSVKSRDVANGKLTIRMAWTGMVVSSNIAMTLTVDGTPLNKSINSISSTSGSQDIVFDIADALDDGIPNISFLCSGTDYNGSARTGAITEIEWSNASAVSISSVSVKANDDECTVTGTVTNLPSGYDVEILVYASNGISVTKTVQTTASDTGSGAPYTGKVYLANLPNGTLTAEVRVRDQQGVLRKGLKTFSWDGNGNIAAFNSKLTYDGNGVGTISGQSTIIGDWAANPDWKARLYYYDNDTDTSATLHQTYTPTISGTQISMSWYTVNIPHGAQMYIQFEGTDAAGKRRTVKSTNRSAMTHALKASMFKVPTRIGTAGSGKSLFEYAIANYLEYSLYQGSSPTTRYKNPQGNWITVGESLNRWVGTTAYFRFELDDRSLAGLYEIAISWSTAQSQPSGYITLNSTVNYTKEDPAELSTTSFYITTRYVSSTGQNIPTGMRASGKLEAPSPANKTVYVTFGSEHGDSDTATYTDQTDTYGAWSVSTNGMDGVYQNSREPIWCDARVTYGGKNVTATRRSTLWPDDGRDPF